MPIQANLWTDFLLCPICQHDFSFNHRPPISLGCGHTICKLCLATLHRKQCPLDQTVITQDIDFLPINNAILQLVQDDKEKDKEKETGKTTIKDEAECSSSSSKEDPPTEVLGVPLSVQQLSTADCDHYNTARTSIEKLALYLKPYVYGSSSGTLLSRPMLRKLITLVNCQLMEDEGRARSLRAARSLGERTVTELILQHQNPQQLSTNLWAAVRARGCQFLGPAMQEEVLKLVLMALQDGSALSRKVLVMFVVQRLEPHFHQASKTSIGHVVQLLYRASCFKVSKREGDSSLMQLKEEYRTYEALRREHDAQIVQIATEAGLRIAPDQWSQLLYGDTAHKSHMQSIIDKLQTPQSFEQSVQELVIALQRTGDPANLSGLRNDLKFLSNIDPTSESNNSASWSDTSMAMKAVLRVVQGLVEFVQMHGNRKLNDVSHLQNSKYKISFCRDLKLRGTCPRAGNCTFAHSEDELERYRTKIKKLPLRATASTPKEIEYLSDHLPRPSFVTSVAEDISPMRSRGRPPNAHPPLHNHLSLPANPSAAFPNAGLMPPQPSNRFLGAGPHHPPVVPSPVIRNIRPNSQHFPGQPSSMFKPPLSISPSAPPPFMNELYSNNNNNNGGGGFQAPPYFSQTSAPFLKQLQNAHEYPLDRRKVDLMMRQLFEWEQQQQQQHPPIPSKMPVKNTQSLPMFPTSPKKSPSQMAHHLQYLVSRRQEVARELETRKEEDARSRLSRIELMQDMNNGNFAGDLDFWTRQHPQFANYSLDGGKKETNGPKDMFVRSDSILDDDNVPFEPPTSATGKFGPISRKPSNNKSHDFLLSDENWLFSSSMTTPKTPSTPIEAPFTSDNLLIPPIVNNTNNNNNNTLGHQKLMDSTMLKRLSESSKLQLELTHLDRKIADLKVVNQQEQQQQMQPPTSQQMTSPGSQVRAYPQKRKLTRLAAGMTPLVDPLLPITTSSISTSASSTNPSSASSTRLFWSNSDLKPSPKLWNDNLEVPQSEVKMLPKNSVFDEEGIANGIREIEMRFESDLDEQEKLWPRPSSESLTQEF